MYSLTCLRHLSFVAWGVSAHIKICHLLIWRQCTSCTPRPSGMQSSVPCSVGRGARLGGCASSSLHAQRQQQWHHTAELPQPLPFKNRSGEGGKYLHSKTVMQNLFSNITSSSSSSLFSLAIFWKRCRRELSADTSYDLLIEPQAKHLWILVPQNLIWSMDKCLNSEETKF